MENPPDKGLSIIFIALLPKIKNTLITHNPYQIKSAAETERELTFSTLLVQYFSVVISFTSK